jgi:hypothetical protein
LKAASVNVTVNGTASVYQIAGLPSVTNPAQFTIVLGLTVGPNATAHFDNLYCETSD